MLRLCISGAFLVWHNTPIVPIRSLKLFALLTSKIAQFREDFHLVVVRVEILEGSRLRLPGRCKQRYVLSAVLAPSNRPRRRPRSRARSLNVVGNRRVSRVQEVENEDDDEDEDDWRSTQYRAKQVQATPLQGSRAADTASFVVAAPPRCVLRDLWSLTTSTG
jgi:hypothetical protein